MRRFLSFFLVAFLPLLTVLAACDSGGSNEETIENEFTLNVQPAASSEATAAPAKSSEGALQDKIEGYSFFYDGEDSSGRAAFGVYMSEAETFSEDQVTKGLFGFLARESRRPDTGTYSFADIETGVGPDNFVGLLYEDFTSIQSAPYYLVKDGTLTLTESSSNRVEGEIEGTATKLVVEGTTVDSQAVEISGEFTAKNVENFVAFNTPGV